MKCDDDYSQTSWIRHQESARGRVSFSLHRLPPDKNDIYFWDQNREGRLFFWIEFGQKSVVAIIRGFTCGNCDEYRVPSLDKGFRQERSDQRYDDRLKKLLWLKDFGANGRCYDNSFQISYSVRFHGAAQ